MARVAIPAALLALASALCSFTQDCPLGACTPPTMLSPPIQPFVTEFESTMMCPELEGQPLCCNNDQNTQLVTKFQLIDYTFGAYAGGCDVCAANMKRMWCHFTCSPDQSAFVHSGPPQMVLDPMNPTPTYVIVMPANFTVAERYAIDLYNSCKKCSYAQQVPAMQSPHGFLEFQGANAVEMGLVNITFDFASTPSALNLSVAACNSKANSTYGYPTHPCSCSK